LKKKSQKTGRNKLPLVKATLLPAHNASRTLLRDVRTMIHIARQSMAATVNTAIVRLYWQIGRRARKDILRETRAEYGQEILATLSQELTAEFGRGFSVSNLSRMMALAEAFPNEPILAALSQELGWSHFIELLPLERPQQRDFYAEMCRLERWSVRTLRQKIDSMLYERTALSKKPAKLIAQELRQLREEDKLTPDLVFRDPHILDFLGLKDTYAEKNLEEAILREMESFILELGVGFAFVARQKRMTIDGKDYHLDLLFYHRKMRRLVALDLKIGEFTAADKGQMELYLGWLKRHEAEPEEDEPLGVILCAGNNKEHMELLELQKSGIHVATYQTDFLPAKELERKLHEAVKLARASMATRRLPEATP
jgi:predicted nuclease of restriction endonuclease-like (RecB) superfamily